MCRFLGVQDYYDADRVYSGYFRVMVHSNESMAAIWEVVNVGGKKYMQIKENASMGEGVVGWYLAIPPGGKRDSLTYYLAATPDIVKAMAVKIEPAQ